MYRHAQAISDGVGVVAAGQRESYHALLAAVVSDTVRVFNEPSVGFAALLICRVLIKFA